MFFFKYHITGSIFVVSGCGFEESFVTLSTKLQK